MTWIQKKFQHLVAASDSLLVTKAKQGDSRAFEKLYMRYVQPIYRYMYFHLNQNRSEAEDATSKVFFQIMKSLPQFEMKEERSFRGWIYTVARNIITDEYRKKPKIALSEEIIDEAQGPEEQYQAREAAQILKIGMQALSKEQKEVITLRSIEGYTYQEISALLAKKEDAIRAIHSRGMKLLKASIPVDVV